MYLGVDRSRYVVYEGDLHWCARPILPSPHIFDMQLGDTPEAAIKKLLKGDSVFDKFLFWEDTFDPVTMVRRGRIYEAEKNGQPRECRVEPAYNAETLSFHGSGVIKKSLNTYQRYPIASREKVLPRYAAIGAEGAFSLWRIVSTDRMHFGEELLTLRPYHSMGALPDLDLSKVSDPWKTKVKETVQKVVDVMNIANSDSIIELCRHAASAALFAYFHEDIQKLAGTDLGHLADRAGKDGKRIIASCGRIIADLHSRLKVNMQVEHDLRPVSDRDAELAIYSLSCILSDLKFTNERR